MTDYATSHPAATGETVTQGHADYCAAHGHSTYTVDGEVAPWCARCGEDRDDSVYTLTNVADADLPDAAAKVGLYLKETTGMGLDFTADELDDLTSRKVDEVPFSGDDLHRIIRARRGVARATGQADIYGADLNQRVRFGLWGSFRSGNQNRRMVAVGSTYASEGTSPFPGALISEWHDDVTGDPAWEVL